MRAKDHREHRPDMRFDRQARRCGRPAGEWCCRQHRTLTGQCPANLQRWTIKRLDDAFRGFLARIRLRSQKVSLFDASCESKRKICRLAASRRGRNIIASDTDSWLHRTPSRGRHGHNRHPGTMRSQFGRNSSRSLPNDLANPKPANMPNTNTPRTLPDARRPSTRKKHKPHDNKHQATEE